MRHDSAVPLLRMYFLDYLKSRDPVAFESKVRARYSAAALERILDEGDAEVRRAAVFAIGLTGTIDFNPRLAGMLRDDDPVVRSLAENALWNVWFRADSPENNARLLEIRELIAAEKLDEAIRAANRLIADAPRFAEAYNQRAIAHFFSGDLGQSEADCRKTLELNPYHFGAISGMGQCLLRTNRLKEAANTYRRALKLQPYHREIKELLEEIDSVRPKNP